VQTTPIICAEDFGNRQPHPESAPPGHRCRIPRTIIWVCEGFCESRPGRTRHRRGRSPVSHNRSFMRTARRRKTTGPPTACASSSASCRCSWSPTSHRPPLPASVYASLPADPDGARPERGAPRIEERAQAPLVDVDQFTGQDVRLTTDPPIALAPGPVGHPGRIGVDGRRHPQDATVDLVRGP
jgi:hypothetical protein